MPADRFYYNGPLNEGAQIELIDAEHHHLRVVKISLNESIEIVNGQGSLASAQLLNLGKKGATLKILSSTTVPKPTRHLILAVPLMRPSKLELVAEKGTELGADAFYFYQADHSEKEGLSHNQLERLHLLILSALKQSGRLYLPSIELLPDLKTVLQTQGTLLYGDVRPNAPLLQIRSDKTLFVSGPERGFSTNEQLLLEKSAKSVRLGPYILRAETAPLAAAAILSTI